jgi:hypothetical protein
MRDWLLEYVLENPAVMKRILRSPFFTDHCHEIFVKGNKFIESRKFSTIPIGQMQQEI